MKKFLFILFGAPGSGKGFLGSCLKEKIKEKGLSVKYVSTGDLLREEIAAKTPMGVKLAQIVSSGQLVSDEIVSALVEKALQTDEDVMFLDGYPRTYVQFDALRSQVVDKFVVITIMRDTPIELIIERVSKRRVCRNCKATHSTDDGCCPQCGGESIIRSDDAVIDKRLAEYERNTASLWSDLKLISNEMYVVDGRDDAEIAAEEIVSDIF